MSRFISSDRVEGTKVYSNDGDELGTINTIMIDKMTGEAEYVVITFGAVLVTGSGYYPVPWQMLRYDRDADHYIVDITKDVLMEAPRYPSHDRPTFDNDYADQLADYYAKVR